LFPLSISLRYHILFQTNMIFTTAWIACLLPAFAAAQYGNGDSGSSSTSPAPTASSTSAPAAAPSAPADTTGQKNVDVFFNKTFTFHPANLTASNGTLVTFWFPNSAVSHSVTQSSFAAPCTYLAANGSVSAGFDSGLQTAKHFTINITDDSKPIWFHCKQGNHCGMGMVGSINAPTSGNTYAAFEAAALKIGSSQAKETDNGPVTGGVNGIATAPPTTATAAAATTTTAKPNSSIKVAASTGIVLFAAVIVATFV
jgi:plastocyanin